MTSISFDLPMPPSVNSMYRNVPGKGRVNPKDAKKWAAEAGWMLVAQRNRDGRHKCIKALLDLLTSTKTIADIVAINARWVDEGVPCTVTVREA